MQIKRLRLKNITCFDEKEIEFKPLTFIFGPDGSGKTTIRSCLELLLSGSSDAHGTDTLLAYGKGSGSFSADIELNEHPRELSKSITEGSVKTDGMSLSRLLSELKVTKPALELMGDVWSVLQKSPKDLCATIDKALNTSLSRDDVIKLIAGKLAESDRDTGTLMLEGIIKRTTTDMLTTATKSIDTSRKTLTKELEANNTTIAGLEKEKDLVKNVNMEMVKKVRDKIETENIITSREREIKEAQIWIDETRKDLDRIKEEEFKGLVLIEMQPLHDVKNKLEVELKMKQEELKNIPEIDTDNPVLPCKWFGKCALDSEESLKLVAKTREADKLKKSNLALKIDELISKLEASEKAINEAKVKNVAYDSIKEELDKGEQEIVNEKKGIERLQKIIDDLKKTLPDVDSKIGDALFTIADKIEESTEEIVKLKAANEVNTNSLAMLDKLEPAIIAAKGELSATRTPEFVNILVTDLKTVFGTECTYDPIMGMKVNGLPYNYMSTSQNQRIGICLMHALALTTGIGIMFIDDMNVITDYNGVSKLIIDAVEKEKMQVILFSSMANLEFVNKEVDSIIRLDPVDLGKAREIKETPWQ